MEYLFLAFSATVCAEFIHSQQGVYSNPNVIEFDARNAISSHPDMISYVQGVYDRNVRRGLTNPSELSNTDKQIILDLHNKIRSETARGLYPGPGGSYQPQSCDMNALSWSVTLERLATEWSSQCYFEHSTDCSSRMTNIISSEGLTAEWNRQSTDSCGENLYISGAAPALNAVYGDKNYGMCGGIEDGWSRDEAEQYVYQSSFDSAAGHYTQVVWANTRYVGCGFRQCDGISSKSSSYSWGKLMFTCNYYPPGNYGHQYPYKSGAACSCCDGDRAACSHDGGLCGGGWNSDFNVKGAVDTSTVDRCYDGVGRNVCSENGQPTLPPSANPTKVPTKKPSLAPSIWRVTNAPTISDGVRYAIRVSAEIVWLTHSYDYDDIGAAIEELMFATLAEPYVGLTAANVDESASSRRGPFCANPCYYIYGFNTVPMVLEGATAEQKSQIVADVNDGSFAASLCDEITNRYSTNDNLGLRCYRVTAGVESITETEL